MGITQSPRRADPMKTNTEITRSISAPRIIARSLRSFLLAFCIKSGVSFSLHLLRLSRHKGLVPVFLSTVLYNRDAYRIGSVFGLFTFLFHTTVILVNAVRRPCPPHVVAFIAGMVAGTSLALEKSDNRLMLCQQFTMRALQASYNGLKQNGFVHFPLGDSLLFVVSSAQVMYSYAFWPSTLPADFFKFMVNMARINPPTLRANACTARGMPIDHLVDQIRTLAANCKRTHPLFVPSLKDSHNLAILPCFYLHPETPFCSTYLRRLCTHVFKTISPVYLTFNTVPTVVLRPLSILKDPIQFLRLALFNTLRSTGFLITYISVFQSLACLLRKAHGLRLVQRDRPAFYFLFGILNSLSILIEDKKRRSELGLYVAPKAIHSLYQIMSDHKRIVPKLPKIDVILFSVSMGVIMSFYTQEPDWLSPMIRRLLPQFIR